MYLSSPRVNIAEESVEDHRVQLQCKFYEMEGKYTEANDTWAGGVKVSEKDKVNLKMKGIEFHKEVRIPDSDDDSEEEGEVEDEEDSDEDSVISPSLNDSSEEESSGEESSEDEAVM